jgi:hypothetical protein
MIKKFDSGVKLKKSNIVLMAYRNNFPPWFLSHEPFSIIGRRLIKSSSFKNAGKRTFQRKYKAKILANGS